MKIEPQWMKDLINKACITVKNLIDIIERENLEPRARQLNIFNEGYQLHINILRDNFKIDIFDYIRRYIKAKKDFEILLRNDMLFYENVAVALYKKLKLVYKYGYKKLILDGKNNECEVLYLSLYNMKYTVSFYILKMNNTLENN